MAIQKRYFIQDTRTCVGNSAFFWCWDRQGYTCDLRMAGVYEHDEAMRIVNGRGTDKAWPIEELLPLVQHHVDIQDLRHNSDRPHTYSHLGVAVGERKLNPIGASDQP